MWERTAIPMARIDEDIPMLEWVDKQIALSKDDNVGNLIEKLNELKEHRLIISLFDHFFNKGYTLESLLTKWRQARLRRNKFSRYY